MHPGNPNQPDPASLPPRTPLSLLAAQAEELTQVTGGRLVGTVLTGRTASGDSEHTLCVRAPALEDRRISLLQVVHTPDLRRIRLAKYIPKGTLSPHDLNELEAALEEVLLSPEVTEEVRGLLAQTLR